MKDHFYRCDGSRFDIPLFDPIVAAHFNNSATLTDHLIDQMGEGSIYHKMFGHWNEFRESLVFLDIGANIGLVSLYAAPACKRIVALEPAPDTFPVLKAMTLTTTNIEPHEMALAPTNDNVEFFMNDLNPTASSTVNTYGTRITVPGMTLTSILSVYQLEHVDIVKIDAEGAEGHLTPDELRNAKDIIQSYYIETHNCPRTTWQSKLSILAALLIENGYNKMSIDGMTLYATK